MDDERGKAKAQVLGAGKRGNRGEEEQVPGAGGRGI